VKNNISNIKYKEKYTEAQAEIEKLKAEIVALKSRDIENSVLFSDSFNFNKTLTTFADILPFSIAILDENANYTYVNKYGLEFFGYTNEDIKNGLNLAQLVVNKNELQKYTERLKTATLVDEMTEGREFFLVKKNGDKFFGLLYSKILTDTNNKQFLLSVVINHEKYRQVNKEYIRAEEELRQLNATKDKFFSIVAHDLKNPFNAIIGFSELIVNNIDEYTKEQIESFVNVINNSSQKGYVLLENLLEWSRSQSGKTKIKPENFEITELVYENYDLIKEKASQKDIKIEMDCKNKHSIYADKNMINTVIRNLLSNALKFTNKNGKITIKTETIENLKQKDKNCLKVEIADTGIGIKTEDIDKIFDIEYSISTKGTNSEKGTGLGLVLCKDFIEKNDGRIWAVSELEKGSSFIFTLPLK